MRVAQKLLVCLSLFGCGNYSGQIETVMLKSDTLKTGSVFKGVLFYPPQFVKYTHSFTTRVDGNGQVIGSTDDGSCRSVIQKEDVSILPDLGRPMLVRNSSEDHSASKFSVSLSNGMLTAVNAEPTQKPSDMIAATAGLVKDLGGLALALRAGAPPACNAGARITSITRAEIQ